MTRMKPGESDLPVSTVRDLILKKAERLREDALTVYHHYNKGGSVEGKVQIEFIAESATSPDGWRIGWAMVDPTNVAGAMSIYRRAEHYANTAVVLIGRLEQAAANPSPDIDLMLFYLVAAARHTGAARKSWMEQSSAKQSGKVRSITTSKAQAKAEVERHWQEWASKATPYQDAAGKIAVTNTDFARVMLEQYPDMFALRTVTEDWIPEWKGVSSPPPSEGVTGTD